MADAATPHNIRTRAHLLTCFLTSFNGRHSLEPEPIIAAAAGFLIAVLWFDLMFDVQILRHRHSPEVAEETLGSIAAYYRRVTTTASPMGRLVGLVMVVLLLALVWQAVDGDAPAWVSVVSFVAGGLAIGLALLRVFGRARRLGSRVDPPDVQSTFARSILRDHLVCLTGMSTLLVVQLAAA